MENYVGYAVSRVETCVFVKKLQKNTSSLWKHHTSNLYDIHVNACSRAPNSAIQAPKENNRKRRRIESSQSSQSNAEFLDSHESDDEYALKVYHAQFEEELARLKSFMCDYNIWEKFSHLTWEY